jgi:Lamin Tail Domain/Fn3 associated
VYYTVNGVDPRVPSSGAPAGITYSGPIILNQPTTVKARARNNSTGEWSPLAEATFTTAGGFPIIISELMYNPPIFNAVDGDEFEFVELHNTSNAAVNLFGLRLADGVEFNFPAGSSIPANGYLVLAKNTAQFNSKYPGVAVFGQYGPGTSLNNAGETVSLVDANNTVVFSVTYDDIAPWPAQADGDGNSLVPLNPNGFATPANASNAADWRKSTNLGGSPGQIDPVNIQAVYLNELLASPSTGQTDAVELYNPGATDADISDWWLSDSAVSPKKYRFPSGTTVPAGEYLVVTEAEFNPTPGQGASFEFNKFGGEDVVLASGDVAGNLTGYFHQFTNFPATLRGTSLGPYTDSSNTVRFLQLASLTLGAANSGIKVGPVVITEVMYNAPAGKVDYIELANISDTLVSLFDATVPANRWRVFGIEFEFPASIVLQPRQIVILSATDPDTFRTMYSLPAEVAVYQFTTGNLANNGGELISLQQPAEGQSTPATAFVDVDFVNYRDTPPWPAAADGNGSSLERVNWRAFGDDVVNWRASATNGGSGALTSLTFDQWQAVYFTPSQIADANYGGSNADPENDGLSNFWEFALGLNPLARDAQGAYSISLMNDGAAGPFLTLQYRRNLGAPSIQFHMDTTGSVGTWTPDGGIMVGAPVNNGDGTETIKRRDTQQTSEASQRFLRLRINN